MKQWWANKNKQQKKLILMGSVAVILLIAIGVTFTLRSKTTNVRKANDLKPAVDVVVVQRKDMKKQISLTGPTVPEAQVDITAKYSGKIAQVNVELGQAVVQGQVLMVQDTSDVDISILANSANSRQAEADAIESNASFEANYQKAQANYQRSVTNYQRYQTLYEQGAVSREALDNKSQDMSNAKAELEGWSKQIMSGATAASVESKRAAREKALHTVDSLENQRQDLILRAPRAGVIGYRQAEVGNLAQPGQKLLSIVDNSNLYVDCSVSEQDIGQIQVGMPASVQIESLGKSYKGKVIYVSPANDPKTLTYTARIALNDADASIKSGMFARTAIEVLLRQKTIFVPKQAVEEKNGKYRVFVVKSDNQAEERIVKLGLRNDKEIEIIEGINEGEQVAISNLARLKTGVTTMPAVVSGQ